MATLLLLLAQMATVQAQAPTGMDALPAGTPQDTPQDTPNVVGGERVAAGEMTWVVALVEHDAMTNTQASANAQTMHQFCGGSLIAPGWVLTAAHCVTHRGSGQIDVLVGRNDLAAEYGEHLLVEAVIAHPEFQYWDLEADVALLRLDGRSAFTPVALAEGTLAPLLDETTNTVASVAGWGMVDEFVAAPDGVLRRTEVALVNRGVCNAADSYDGRVGEGMLCAGWAEGGRDACFGDSGGPLALPAPESAASWSQIGIVSWGDGCARPRRYGIYTSVVDFAPWIRACLVDASSTLCRTGHGEPPLDNTPESAPLEIAPITATPPLTGSLGISETEAPTETAVGEPPSTPAASADTPDGIFLPLVVGS